MHGVGHSSVSDAASDARAGQTRLAEGWKLTTGLEAKGLERGLTKTAGLEPKGLELGLTKTAGQLLHRK